MEVDHVVAVHRQPQLAVIQADAGRQRVAQVALADRSSPGRSSRRAAPLCCAGHVGVDAEAARPRAGVVLLPDVREVHVADLVLVVERDQQPAVTDRNVTWHGEASFCTNAIVLRAKFERTPTPDAHAGHRR